MKISALDALLGTYYNEDYVEQGGLWGTLDLFLTQEDEGRPQELLLEIDEVLSRYTTEAELDALLNSFHCAVYMGGEPGGTRAWLREIATRVRAHLGDQ